jgi:hypothetical protein
MSMTLFFNDICPKCQNPTMRGSFESHPTNPGFALQSFECAGCGPIKTKVVPLKRVKPSSGMAA